jgi:hypothetical protein
MPDPGIPDSGPSVSIDLPCGETVSTDDLDLGMREYFCRCGESHAVVMDPHPLSRFIPESIVETLQESLEPTHEEFDEFEMTHLMGILMEEYPDMVVGADASGDGSVGYAAVWVTDVDARELHRLVVEEVLGLMESAVSHAEDQTAMTAFEADRLEFDVAAFVDEYRAQRDFEDEYDEPV